MGTTVGTTLVRRWFGEAMNSGSETVARAMSEQIFAADFVDHDGLDAATHGRAEWQESVLTTIFGAFDEIEVIIEQRRIYHTENEIYRIAAGRIAESWGEGNWLGTLRQLGVRAQ
jgi:hypothetical protein